MVMSKDEQFDLVVIGAGTAANAVARACNNAGWKVVSTRNQIPSAHYYNFRDLATAWLSTWNQSRTGSPSLWTSPQSRCHAARVGGRAMR